MSACEQQPGHNPGNDIKYGGGGGGGGGGDGMVSAERGIYKYMDGGGVVTVVYRVERKC